jgi:hypothetical protein
MATAIRQDDMQQIAPYPVALERLVDGLVYKPGWSFWLDSRERGQGSTGLTLIISIEAPDTNDFDSVVHVSHYMPVPPAAYLVDSWRWWLFSQILLVEQHEAAEFFRIDGEKPFAPNHGEGEDPYRITQLTTQEARSKTFRDA